MNKLLTTFLAIAAFCTTGDVQANMLPKRGMYVGQFYTILGDAKAEQALLEYAKNNKITYLALYTLHRDIIGNSDREQQLSDFILKAKTLYGVQEVGAVIEGKAFFAEVNDYNGNHPDCLTKEALSELYPELSDILNNLNLNLSILNSFFCYNLKHLGKFDVLNTEYEYWNEDHREEAFKKYVDVLTYVKTISQGTVPAVKAESYLGWPSPEEVEQISPLLDRVLLHAYRTDADQTYSYTRTRLSYFGSQGKKVTVYPIFSAEKDFMGGWLKQNSVSKAEETFQAEFDAETADWKENIDLGGYQWFTYADMSASRVVTGIKALWTGDENKISQCYPNPADGTVQMNFTLTNGSMPTFLQIIDENGRLKHFERLRDVQGTIELDVKEYAPGTYYYSLITDQDATKWQAMVVVH